MPSRSLRSARSSIASTWWRRSRWTVGSSRTRTGAAWATAMASRTSWRSPSESSRASRPRRCPTPTRSIAAATAARSAGRRPRSGCSWGSRPSATTSSTRVENGSEAAGARRPAAARRRAGRARRSAAAEPDRTVPEVGRSEPGERRAAGVDLPAPFGPRSATRSPRPIDEVDAAQDRPVDGRRPRRRSARRSGPRTASQLVARARPAQQGEEERRPDDRGHDPDRDVAEQPRHEVGGRPGGLAPRSAESGRTRRAFGPDDQPDDVRRDEPDEADQAADRRPPPR